MLSTSTRTVSSVLPLASPATRRSAGLAWAVAHALLFSCAALFSRMAQTTAHWSLVGLARAGVGLAMALGLAHARGASLQTRDTKRAWLRAIFGTAGTACTFAALGMPGLSLADAVTLYYLYPVFVAALSPLVLGEKVGRGLVLVIGSSLTGVVLMLRPAALFGHGAIAPGMAAGALTATIGALSVAASMLLLRGQGRTEGPEAIMFHFSLLLGAFHALVALFVAPWPAPRDLALTLLVGIVSAGSQYAMTRAYALESAGRVGAIGYLSVAASSVLGAVALAELPDILALAGMALVTVNAVVLLRAKKPTNQESKK